SGGGTDHAKLEQHSTSRVKSIFRAVAGLPGKAVPHGIKRVVAKVKDKLIAGLKSRYGERGASIILKVAALSAPIPVPGSQPAAIALSLVIAEGVRAFRRLRGTGARVAHEAAEPELTEEEIRTAVSELLEAIKEELAQ